MCVCVHMCSTSDYNFFIYKLILCVMNWIDIYVHAHLKSCLEYELALQKSVDYVNDALAIWFQFVVHMPTYDTQYGRPSYGNHKAMKLSCVWI